MEDPLSPQPNPNPDPTPVRPSPGLNTLPRSHMRTADRQLASQSRRQSSTDLNPRQAGLEQVAEGLGLVRTSPLDQGGPNAAMSVGGLKLARTPISKSAGKNTHLLERLPPNPTHDHNPVHSMTLDQLASHSKNMTCCTDPHEFISQCCLLICNLR